MTKEEFSNKNREIQLKQGDFLREITDHIIDLIGTDKRVVLCKPVKAYGDYGEITELAVGELYGSKILMAKCSNGWCDKPIQPYYASYERLMDIGYQIFYSRRPAKIADGNPLAGKKIIVAC